MSETTDVQVTYGDLRDGDVIVDKAGGTWLAQEVASGRVGVDFWLCTIPANVRTHQMTKPAGDPVTVRRPVTHAETVEAAETDFDAAQLREADALTGDPAAIAAAKAVDTARCAEHKPIQHRDGKPPWCSACGLTATYAHPVSRLDNGQAVETLQAAGVVTASEPVMESSAAEVDAVAVAQLTGQPVDLPAFSTMTPLEQRTHIFLLHGVVAYDVRTAEGLAEMHDDCHAGHDGGTLQAKYVAHVHAVATA